MNAYALFEFAVIGGALLLSLWTALGKLAPGWRRSMVARLRGKPAPVTVPPGGCSNCNSCGDCETPKPAARTEQPIRFERR